MKAILLGLMQILARPLRAILGLAESKRFILAILVALLAKFGIKDQEIATYVAEAVFGLLLLTLMVRDPGQPFPSLARTVYVPSATPGGSPQAVDPEDPR